MRREEYIICAAVWFDDGIYHEDSSLKGRTGYVICGRRHHNCFHTASILNPARDYIKYEKEQGFMTNGGLFVSRHEAAEIAYNSGQIIEATKHPLGLFSEDLY